MMIQASTVSNATQAMAIHAARLSRRSESMLTASVALPHTSTGAVSSVNPTMKMRNTVLITAITLYMPGV